MRLHNFDLFGVIVLKSILLQKKQIEANFSLTYVVPGHGSNLLQYTKRRLYLYPRMKLANVFFPHT